MQHERGECAHSRALVCLFAVLFLGIAITTNHRHAAAGDAFVQFTRGDCNVDGSVSIVDAIGIVNYLFSDEVFEIDCLDSADVNDDELLNLADAIYLLTYLFNDGSAIAEPTAECGNDETASSLLSCNSFALCAGSPPNPLPVVDDGGWTVFEPTPNTLVIYVSSSEGDDSNDGLSPESPKATISAGYDELRDGYPDWLLLKRGDEWEESIPDWEKSGESEVAPMLVSSYGDTGDRPMLKTGNDQAFMVINGNNLPVLRHIAIVGLHCYAHTRDPNHPDFSVPAGNVSGFFVLHEVEDLLIEDCLVEYYGQGITITGENAGHFDVRLRRCVVLDSYSTDSNAEGAFFGTTHGLTIEECIFDHNGWNDDVVGAVPNIFRHSIYVYGNCSDVAARRNIILRSASHGAQLRAGGAFDDNLLIQNSIGIAFWDYGTVHGNVILESKDISPSLPRAVGIWLQEANSTGIMCDQNIIANDIGAEWGNAITVRSEIATGVDTLVIDNNTIYAHKGSLQLRGFNFTDLTVSDNLLQNPIGEWELVDAEQALNTTNFTFEENVYYSNAPADEWFIMEWVDYSFDDWTLLASETDPVEQEVEFEDPTRTVVDYQQSIGGEVSEDAFFAEVRLQSKHYWRAEYSITNLLDYFRAGFALVTDLGPDPPGAVASDAP
ncbi:MAG: right-handed parallel beta-helix repeat-containing protein [Planctomycetes bacterium]|nr:right-handed parallel beta-helix repeat-containing protein [Planctomycetota bacterium]